MVRADEVARHRIFWAEQRSRAAAQRARLAALSGDQAAARAVRDGWAPVILARLEARLVERNDEDE